jgi:hypothetical protein
VPCDDTPERAAHVPPARRPALRRDGRLDHYEASRGAPSPASPPPHLAQQSYRNEPDT